MENLIQDVPLPYAACQSWYNGFNKQFSDICYGSVECLAFIEKHYNSGMFAELHIFYSQEEVDTFFNEQDM